MATKKPSVGVGSVWARLLSVADNSLAVADNLALSGRNASEVLVVKSENYLSISKVEADMALKEAEAELAEMQAELKAAGLM
jgi:hypothetical protein